MHMQTISTFEKEQMQTFQSFFAFFVKKKKTDLDLNFVVSDSSLVK